LRRVIHPLLEAHPVRAILSDFHKSHLLVKVTRPQVPGWRFQRPAARQRKFCPHELKGLGPYPLVLEIRGDEDAAEFIVPRSLVEDNESADDLVVGQYLVVSAYAHQLALPPVGPVTRRPSRAGSTVVNVVVERLLGDQRLRLCIFSSRLFESNHNHLPEI
jgi:hypothetical protein